MGSAVNISLISHIDTACIGINMDPVAVRQPDLFLEHLHAAFDEMLHIGREFRRSRRRSPYAVATSEVSA